MESARPHSALAVASGLVALIVGVKVGGALALHWLVAPAAALVVAATTALALVGFTAAFGGARPRGWRVAALGAVGAILFLALRALA